MKKIVLTIHVLIMLLLLSACGVNVDPLRNDSPTDTEEVTRAYSAQEIFDLFSLSTVHIESSSGGGTGFFVEENVVATNNHVVSGADWLTVKTVDGEIFDVIAVIASSENPDLALLEIDGKGKPIGPLAHEIFEGEPVYCIGAPMGIFPCISDGIVMKSSYIDSDVEFILSNFHSIGGNSGGPVLNAYGELIGVVVGGMSDGSNSIDMVISGKYLSDMDCSNPKELSKYEDWVENINRPEEEKYELASIQDAQPGQLVSFGRYEQDNDASNGTEEIYWIVKDRQGDKLTLMSLYCLDVVPYHNGNEEVTWETSDIRVFLNNDFLQNAFTDEEQSKIVISTVVNNDNIVHGTAGGNNTEDMIYLPSLEEIMEYYGIPEPIEMFYDHLYAQATEYAMNKGVWLEMENSSRCWWWLRSSGGNPQNASEVGSMGYLSFNGTHVGNTERAIRPMLQVSAK